MDPTDRRRPNPKVELVLGLTSNLNLEQPRPKAQTGLRILAQAAPGLQKPKNLDFFYDERQPSGTDPTICSGVP